MALVVDTENLGPSEATWSSSLRLAQLDPLRDLQPDRVVVVAPHPDDEILGAGGLLHALHHRGIAIEIMAVTDGEASHPELNSEGQLEMRSTRAEESNEGLRRLGWEAPSIRRFALPDGGVSNHFGDLCELLEEVLRPGDLCLAPWQHDGHPDHDACGRAANLVARSRGTDLLHYLVWAWHWTDPEGDELPWEDLRRFDLSRRARATKRWASSAFLSQIRPLNADRSSLPILPAPIMRRFWRPFEVFVDPRVDQ